MEKEQKQMEKRKREQVVKGGREKEDKLRLESNPSFCTLFDHRFFFMAFTHASIYICMYLWIRSSIITHSRVPSRPIMGYLVSKYAKNDSLYPKDPKRRGIVDQMLYFDIGTLNENVVKCYVRIFSFPFYAFEGHFSEPS